MGLRIIGTDEKPIVDVAGPAALPVPAGYLDATGVFHRECSHLPGACTSLFTGTEMAEVLRRLQAATAEAQFWNRDWR